MANKSLILEENGNYDIKYKRIVTLLFVIKGMKRYEESRIKKDCKLYIMCKPFYKYIIWAGHGYEQ